jgi:hypothetical protein
MKKVYQLLATFLCLATPSFSSGYDKFSESDMDPTNSKLMYYLRAYAAQHPEAHEISQSIITKIEQLKESNTVLMRNLKRFNPEALEIFQQRINVKESSNNEAKSYDNIIANSDFNGERLGVYIIIALKLFRIPSLSSEQLSTYVEKNSQCFQPYTEIRIAIQSLKDQYVPLIEELNHFRDGTHKNNKKKKIIKRKNSLVL